ncbi:hypothetical protein OIN81_06980 [Acinetobacter baumannii]|nr:hypothetical protein [Acinetobacter baumannii]
MIKNILKYLLFIFMGFVGGCLSPMFLSLFKAHIPASLDQAVAIANTYIVFTTIFFVGVTVLTAIGGYVLSQQLATTREHLENQAYEALLKKLQENEAAATRAVASISQNGDFKNQMTEFIKGLTAEILNEAQQQSSHKANEEKLKSDKLKGMLSNLERKEGA